MAEKRALVTGAGGRLGQAMAVYLAERGFDVAVHYASSRIGADETVQRIQEVGLRAVAIQADLLHEAETKNLVTRAVEALGGPLSVLVNNASIFEADEILTSSRENWDRHFESNLRAPYVLTQDFARQVPSAVVDNRGEPLAQGLVVNMIDQRVRKLNPMFSTYTLAKMALWAFTQTAAQGLAPYIRVNAIGPGPTLQGERQTSEDFAAQRGATILRRGSNPDDITAALGYFLDAPAITGQLLCVDGGQHLGWETPDVLAQE